MKPIRKKKTLPPTPRSDSAVKYVATDLDGVSECVDNRAFRRPPASKPSVFNFSQCNFYMFLFLRVGCCVY